MTGTWLAKRRKDQYYRLARIRGYRSRSAYKLQQTIRTYGIVKPGQKVVDLGAQPGGWLQIARETVGPEGLVLGIDIKEIQPLHSPNVKLLKMDVYAEDVPDRIIAELGGPANTVLSDLAPSIIGAWDVDQRDKWTWLEEHWRLLRRSWIIMETCSSSSLRAPKGKGSKTTPHSSSRGADC